MKRLRHKNRWSLRRNWRYYKSLARWKQGLVAVVFLVVTVTPNFIWILHSSALTQGPLATTSGVDNAGVGVSSWTSPGSISANDTIYASNALATAITGHYLFATGFGFTVPTGSTINGILAEVEENSLTSTKGTVVDNSVLLVKTGAVIGTNLATASTWPTTNSFVSYGGSTNLWGTTLTVADVNAANFGVAVSAKNVKAGAGATLTANIDFIRMTVYYTPPPANVSQNSYRLFNNQDITGSTTFATVLGGAGSDYGYSVVQTSDGGYVVTGENNSYGAGSYDMLLAKYDSAGNITGCTTIPCGTAYSSTSSPTATVASPVATVTSPTATVTSPVAAVASPVATNTTVTASVVVAYAGAPATALNNSYNLPAVAIPFRIRFGLGISAIATRGNSLSLKLQYAVRGSDNKCDTSFTGETYADITAITPLQFYDDTRYANGAGLYGMTTANSLSDGTNLMLRQQYIEANNFSNNTDITAGQDGVWDASLSTASNVSSGSTFCIRVVNSDNSLLSAYSYIPEIQYGPATALRLQHGKYFDSNGTLQPFFIPR